MQAHRHHYRTPITAIDRKRPRVAFWRKGDTPLARAGIYGRRNDQGEDIGGAYFNTRPAGVQTTEVRRRLDEHDRLFDLISAVGSIVRAVNLSGRVPTIAE